ncbi:uncharacterized protein FOMMEDRAFT_24806 [Fomitiporia mediterranea MF3/22]|uniref:uncharacterized protein n=1 Tax=Fomitiporia mediterranea (strain MF3/22) TaxID=694068 RepID=UPI0004408B33|nr:uncharacterized protein FOMMEDRAFT_24806 [Fomitiporia mediterranea MF3/22]EJD07425.1 hypothetical protein FOMMEDRAFT_24806 [Fomitiporia mediterranea MF3/22]
MRVSIALVSVVFALAGSAVAAPLSVNGTLKTRSKVNSDGPNSLENTVTNPSSNIADFFISLANLMSGTQAGGNASVNVGGSADSSNGGSDCINENANGGNGDNGGNGGPGGTVISRKSRSGISSKFDRVTQLLNPSKESNFVDEIEDDPDKTNNTKRGDGTGAVTQTGSNNQICGGSGA